MCCCAILALDDQMGNAPIKRISLFIELLELRLRVIDKQQRSIAVMSGTLEKHVRRSMQVNHSTGLAEAIAIFRFEHGATTGGKYQVAAAGKLLKNLCFSSSEAILALDFEDGRDSNSGTRFNFMVAIQKAALESLGKLAADRRLARSH